MKWRLFLVPACAIATFPGVALGQPVDLPIPAATTTEYPAGISVAKTKAGPVYVDAKGHTLYGLDLRTLQRWSPDPAMYCKDGCDEWEPVLAPADSKPNVVYPHGFGRGGIAGFRARLKKLEEQGIYSDPQKAPDWTIIEGPQGPQWVYKGWNMVYTRKGDKPGSTQFDGADSFTWNTLKFVPPVPEVAGPENVAPVFVEGSYALSLGEERLLYTGRCTSDCGQWKPLAAGMASRGLGDWKVNRDGDTPQWTFRGKPVFVSESDDPTQLPTSGTILRP